MPPAPPPEVPGPRTPRTLSIDIGGTALKSLVLDATGSPVTERVRVQTPRPATPRRVLQALWALVEPLGTFERVSVRFPGVVVDGVDPAPRPTCTLTGPASRSRARSVIASAARPGSSIRGGDRSMHAAVDGAACRR